MSKSKRPVPFIAILSLFIIQNSCNNLTEQEIEFRQSYDSGKAIYETRCANCHKKDGQGLGTLYPPITKSDYLETHWNELPCIIYKGIKGPVTVNGIKYDWEMPDNKIMDEIQMSAILTYVKGRWGKTKQTVSYEEARIYINECRDSGVRGKE